MLGGDKVTRSAFLLGARLGLEYRTSPGSRGLRVGGFGEFGAGRFSATSYGGPGGFSDRTAWAPYGELGLSAAYRFGTGATRPSVGLETAVGGAMGPGVIGDVTPEIERDPLRFRAFRLGLSLTGEF
jgi:hypothetical protein